MGSFELMRRYDRGEERSVREKPESRGQLVAFFVRKSPTLPPERSDYAAAGNSSFARTNTLSMSA